MLFFSASPAVSDFAGRDKAHTSTFAAGIHSLLCELEPSPAEREQCSLCPLFLGDIRGVYAARKEERGGRRRACSAQFNEIVGRGCTPLSKDLFASMRRVSKQLRGREKKGSDAPPPLSEVRDSRVPPWSHPRHCRRFPF